MRGALHLHPLIVAIPGMPETCFNIINSRKLWNVLSKRKNSPRHCRTTKNRAAMYLALPSEKLLQFCAALHALCGFILAVSRRPGAWCSFINCRSNWPLSSVQFRKVIKPSACRKAFKECPSNYTLRCWYRCEHFPVTHFHQTDCKTPFFVPLCQFEIKIFFFSKFILENADLAFVVRERSKPTDMGVWTALL